MKIGWMLLMASVAAVGLSGCHSAPKKAIATFHQMADHPDYITESQGRLAEMAKTMKIRQSEEWDIPETIYATIAFSEISEAGDMMQIQATEPIEDAADSLGTEYDMTKQIDNRVTGMVRHRGFDVIYVMFKKHGPKGLIVVDIVMPAASLKQEPR